MKLSSRTLLILCILFWSGNYVMGRAVVGTIPPVTLTYVRWVVAFLIFLPFCRNEFKENIKAIKDNWWLFIVFGMTGMMGFNIFQYISVKYTTAINANIINSATPMFTAVAAYFFLYEKLTIQQISGILLAFFGVVTIITDCDWLRIFDLSFNIGDIMMIVAVSINTVYYMVLRKKGRIVPPNTLFLSAVLASLLVGWPLPLLENHLYGTAWIAQLRYYHLFNLLYFAIFPSILSLLFFNRAILDIGPVKTSIYTNLGIVFTSILGIIFLDERLVLAHFLGAGFIVSGVWLTNSRAVKKPKTPVELPED